MCYGTMTRYLTIDCETTCLKLNPKELNGNPFTKRNFLCNVGVLTHEEKYIHFDIEYGDEPYGKALKQIQELIDSHDCIIGFNLKFDLHWLIRYGISIKGKSVFDVQLTEFILSNQSNPYPSLNDTSISYGFEGKLDFIKAEFWDKGIDTDQIPLELLSQYLEQDVRQTHKCFLHQQKIIPDSKRKLIQLQNQDLLTLLEMEKNGMSYDIQTSISKGDKLQEKLIDIDKELVNLSGYADFNPNSGDHISVVLYGGILNVPSKVPYLYTYKDGRTVTKERWGTKEVVFKRIVTPLKGSELKKDGFFSTNADTLNNLRASGLGKRLIQLLLERAELEKLRGTYLHGIPKLIAEQGWEDGYIHGQLNQCVAITGRLSSSKPNLQNMDGGIGYLFRSRYAD